VHLVGCHYKNVFSVLLHYVFCCQQYGTHLGLHVKCLIFLSDFKQIWIFSTIFKLISIKVQVLLSYTRRNRWKDRGRTGMIKQILAYRELI